MSSHYFNLLNLVLIIRALLSQEAPNCAPDIIRAIGLRPI